jgi:CRISPR-associated endonuclease Cas2
MKNKEVAITIGKCILILLAFSAFMALAATAPNIFQVIKLFQKRDKNLKSAKEKSIQKALYRLKNQKLILITEKDGKTIVEITQKGKVKALKYKIENIKIKKPKSWDKKWRLVIFDISNKKRLARDVLRWKLKQLGFYRFQKSVWIYPYPCEDEIDFIKSVYQIEPNVKLVTAEKMEDEDKYLKIFRLKK